MLDLSKYFSVIWDRLPQTMTNRFLFICNDKIHIYDGVVNTIISLYNHDDFQVSHHYNVCMKCVDDAGIMYRLIVNNSGDSNYIEILKYDLNNFWQLAPVHPPWYFDATRNNGQHIVVKNKLYKISEGKMMIISLDTLDMKSIYCPDNDFDHWNKVNYCYDGNDIIYYVVINKIVKQMKLFMLNIHTEIINIISTNNRKEVEDYSSAFSIYYHERKIYFHNEALEDKVIIYDILMDSWTDHYSNKEIFMDSNLVKDGYFTYGAGYKKGESLLVKFVVPETKTFKSIPKQYSDMIIMTA